MVLIQAGNSHSPTSHDETGRDHDAGPVFVPPRRPSAYARRLMEEASGEGEAVTPYDEMWFAGRPSI